MSEATRSFGGFIRTVIITLLSTAGVVAALLLLAHVFIRPVAPAQPTPPGHFGEPCVLCHVVTERVDIIDFTE